MIEKTKSQSGKSEVRKTAYLIGIKGIGMTALAIFLKQSGYEVSGSDVSEFFPTDEILKEAKIPVTNGFNPENLKSIKPDLIVVSAAYGQDNPEVKIARKRHLPLSYYSEALGQISSGKRVIAIAGIHGKTTTAALLSFILEKAGLDPSFIIGATKVTGLRNIAKKGEGEYFVLEADEYRKSPENNQAKFLDLSSQIAVISSIELDHPDVYPSIEEIYNAFYVLACRIPRNGFIVLCLDYPKAKKLRRSLADRDFETYGFDLAAQWKIVNVQEAGETNFSLNNNGKIIGPFSLKLKGRHNVLNATAAILVAQKLGIQEKTIKKYLSQFSGVKRRFEEIGRIGQIVVIDDYAHHPTAINLTLEAVKKNFPRNKIYCIFQPHTYSRTEKLLKEFGSAFKNADEVLITDIFSSAREKEGKISGADLAMEIKKNQSKVRFIDDWGKVLNYLEDTIEGPSVIITMGAGDIYKLTEKILEYFEIRKNE